MIHKLREMSHGLRKFERVSIHRSVVSKLYTKLEQYSVKPFFYFSDILDFSFFGSDSGKHNTGCHLIKSLDHLHGMVFTKVVQTDC